LKRILFLISCVLLFAPTAGAQKPVSKVCFVEKCITVEIADNDASRMRGLQDRPAMDPNSGMLFVFPHQDVYNFWMKDTLIPLDIIWIDQDLHVVDIKPGVPPCRENPCPLYTPSGPALYVVEMNQGIAETFNIHRGQKVIFK
jgi:uncharacterized membrane protein (UPF0127 family)